MSPVTRPTVKALGDRHAQITVSPRLAFISKALIKKPVNRLVALYAGFDTEAEAQRFAAWVQVNWDKSSFDISVREAERTSSPWEVKIRKPTEAQLAKLVAVEAARLTPERSRMATPEEIAAAPLVPQPRPETFRGVAIT
jgi:hypothetical protein